MDEGPDDSGEWPLEGRESAMTRPADEIEEDGFGDIIHRVSRYDEIETMLFAEALEESIADDAEALLDVVCRTFFWMENCERHGPCFAELSYERFIALRITAPEPIVHVGCTENEIMLLAEPREESEEGDAVRSARDGDEDFRSARQ